MQFYPENPEYYRWILNDVMGRKMLGEVRVLFNQYHMLYKFI